MKIKIIEKEIELNGELEKGKVAPFGTSAHIPFKKRHIGKIVNVIIPEKTKYVWLLTPEEKNLLLSNLKKNIMKEDGKLEHFRLGALDDLKKEEFDIDSLEKLIDFLDYKNLKNKIIRIYNLGGSK